MDGFLYDRALRHERINGSEILLSVFDEASLFVEAFPEISSSVLTTFLSSNNLKL